MATLEQYRFPSPYPGSGPAGDSNTSPTIAANPRELAIKEVIDRGLREIQFEGIPSPDKVRRAAEIDINYTQAEPTGLSDEQRRVRRDAFRTLDFIPRRPPKPRSTDFDRVGVKGASRGNFPA